MKKHLKKAGSATLVLAAGCLFMGCLELKSDGSIGKDDKRHLFRFGDPKAELWGYNKDKKKPFPDHESIRWTSDRDGALPYGNGKARIKLNQLSAGDHTIEAKAKRKKKKVKDDIKIRMVNDAPRPVIETPGNGVHLNVADTTTFRGRASDTEDDAFFGGMQANQFAWKISGASSQNHTGKAVAVKGLLPGNYNVTLTARDRANATGSASQSFRVVNRRPSGEISGPSSIGAGQAITLSAEMFDFDSTSAPRDPNTGQPLPVKLPASSYAWSSSRDGSLGSGGSITVRLSNGSSESTAHTISVEARDEFGARGTATLNVAVTNGLPTITFVSPMPNASFTVVQSDAGIRFQATVSDPDGQPIAANDVTWFAGSSALPKRGSSAVNSLPAGDHQISLRVRDANGGMASKTLGQISVTNRKPIVTINTPRDDQVLKVADAENLKLTASVSDPDGFAIADSSVVWSTSNGTLSHDRGPSVTNSLQKGFHTLYCTATDKHGGSTTASIRFEVVNQAPEARITAPYTSFQQQPIGSVGRGNGLTLEAWVNDPDGFSINDNDVIWKSDLEGELANRGARTTNLLSKLGMHRISCTVTDKHGDSVTTSQVTVHVINLAPTITTIRVKRDSSGISAQRFNSAETVRFEAVISDPDGFPIDDAKVEWSSSVDDELTQKGATIRTDALSVSGARTRHQITCRVTDKHGDSVEKSVRVMITNEAPDRSRIGAPADGSEFKQGQQVEMRGRARDPEDGRLQGESLRWLLQKDGEQLRKKVGHGQRPQPLKNLAAGSYTLTLRAVDKDGLDREVSVRFTVKANQAPVATISSPAGGTRFEKGAEITFTGSATDAESGNVAGNLLSWSAQRRAGGAGHGNGGNAGPARALGTGASVKVSDLKPGRYLITLTATDPADGSIKGTATVRIGVKRPQPQPPVTNPTNGNGDANGNGIAGSVPGQ